MFLSVFSFEQHRCNHTQDVLQKNLGAPLLFSEGGGTSGLVILVTDCLETLMCYEVDYRERTGCPLGPYWD